MDVWSTTSELTMAASFAKLGLLASKIETQTNATDISGYRPEQLSGRRFVWEKTDLTSVPSRRAIPPWRHSTLPLHGACCARRNILVPEMKLRCETWRDTEVNEVASAERPSDERAHAGLRCTN